MANIIIIGKIEKGASVQSYPNSLKVFEPKCPRECGEKITFEGETWVVQSTGFSNKNEAIEVKNSMVKLYVQKGIWSGAKSVASKF